MKKKTLTKKYLKEFFNKLEYIQDVIFDGGTIEYHNNAMLASIMDIEYNDELIDAALKKLENDRVILRIIKRYDKASPPYYYYVDIIPF